MNRWHIPLWLELEVIERDRHCVYCGVEFDPSNKSGKSKPTWEHIVNDARIVSRANIARCCLSCNASKGTDDLGVWFKNEYCKRRGISRQTVAEVVKRALDRPPTIDASQGANANSG
jgi:hypothetical protein